MPFVLPKFPRWNPATGRVSGVHVEQTRPEAGFHLYGVRLLILVLLSSAASVQGAPEPTFHVAPPPLGDDAHDGSAAAPFATLERARQAVRPHLANNARRGDLVVTLHAGTYELAAPVRFDAADSGRDGAAVVYRAAPGETVVLSGGRRVTGWQSEADGVFRAEVGREVDFRQLWVDDRRAERARTPDEAQPRKVRR